MKLSKEFIEELSIFSRRIIIIIVYMVFSFMYINIDMVSPEFCKTLRHIVFNFLVMYLSYKLVLIALPTKQN